MANKLRYVVKIVYRLHDDIFLPGGIVYKVLDLDTDTVGFASYKSETKAQNIADRKNAQPKLIHKNVHSARSNK